ncbi:unnamed protein product [Rotaria sordida]|uniref:Uncharacterized protein n=1 Tax=Rotaria sordida TaxID=392033 RepID=A0A814WWL7_9BILA|nr:unnamed protein product [Rotaria sordida]CAF3693614.1 unnamed protein product [Rotaria sordida]
MNINLFNSIILNLIILKIIYPLVNSTTSCSVFLSLNCSCFQSNIDLNLSLPTTIYSHLYCQGYSLNKNTFQSPFGYHYYYQNRFRTISLEFFLKNKVEIHSNQFDSLSTLFSQTDNDAEIELSIRFNGFTHITFNKYSLTSKTFHQKHYRKNLRLHFIPITPNYIQMEPGEKNSAGIDDQFKFSENCFSGLNVSHLNIYSYMKRDHLSSSFPFEHVFNNTNIGELHFHGSIIPPGPYSLKRTFKGLVRSLTLYRHVDTIDSNTFPYYFPVHSYTIHAIEAHSMDLGSFIPLYTNLRGLELIKPHFEVLIDRSIPTLDSLTLDIEYLSERTLFAAQQINNLKLTSSLRQINPQVFYSLQTHLKHFDLSDVNLSEMTSDSRCYLIHFIHHNYQHQLNIVFPRIENLTECDCARLILIHIQLTKKFKDQYHDDLLCTKKCRFSDCSTISEYFREKYPLFTNNNQIMNNSNGINNNLPSVDLYSDSIDMDMMHFLINQTVDQPIHINQIRSTNTPLTTFRYPSNVLFSTPIIYFDSIDEDKNKSSKSKKTKSFSWMSFLFGSIILLLLILIISSIIFCLVKYRQKKHFKRVPVYV